MLVQNMSFLESGVDSLKNRIKDKGRDHLYEFGCLAFVGNNSFSPCFEEAFNCFKESAIEFNNLVSQFNLGLMHKNGLGVKKDEKEAFFWFLKSAENGYEKAQTVISTYLIEGKYVKQDYIKALHWLRLAMSQGNAEAFYYASIIYNEGLGVQANQDQAVEFLKTSANLGFNKAQFELGRHLYRLGPEHPDHVSFLRYLKLSSSQKNTSAQLFLADVYLTKENLAFCPKKGVDLLVGLAKAGNKDALVKLSEMFDKGSFVEKNQIKAKEFLKKAKSIAMAQDNFFSKNAEVIVK